VKKKVARYNFLKCGELFQKKFDQKVSEIYFRVATNFFKKSLIKK